MHRRMILLAVAAFWHVGRGAAAVHVPGPPELTFVEFTRQFRPAGYVPLTLFLDRISLSLSLS